MVIREKCVRNSFYALLMNYLRIHGFYINGVKFWNAIPEYSTGNGYADLLLFRDLGNSVSPFLLLEFKIRVKRRKSGLSQLQNYCKTINPSYSAIIDFKGFYPGFYIDIYEGCDFHSSILSRSESDIDTSVIDSIITMLTSRAFHSFSTLNPRQILGRYLQRRYKFEDFIKGEIMRSLLSSYSVTTEQHTLISNSTKRYGYIDVAIYDTQPPQPTVIDTCLLCNARSSYPLIAIEVKSDGLANPYPQAQNYGKATLSDYYGTIVPNGLSGLDINIYDTNTDQNIHKFFVSFTSYQNVLMLDSNALLLNLRKIPRRVHNNVIPNGRYYINKLRALGIKEVKTDIKLDCCKTDTYWLPGLVSNCLVVLNSLNSLDYARNCGKDSQIRLSSEAEIPRLLLIYNGVLNWCEFDNGRLVRCNTPVLAVFKECPGFTTCDIVCCDPECYLKRR